ncbi:MAG: 2-oxoacid:acceptor oxidoreductase family protein, partial [Thermoplasmata archaeon]|nr:2-oxoacid:acceptor oxidoreductase family protein [Thermoplasmata archaeon]
MNDDIYSVLIGGEAGQGVRMAGILFSRIMNQVGRHVFEMDDYQSLIRGGHNASCIASSIDPVFSHYDSVDVLVVLDDNAYNIQKDKVKDAGTLIYNSEDVEGAAGIPIPVFSWVKEEGNNPVLAGTIAVSSACALGGVDFSVLEEAIRNAYPKVAEPNIRLAKKTYDALAEHIGKYQVETGDGKLGAIMTGNEAISLGAVAGGTKCYIAYPMTPASSVL